MAEPVTRIEGLKEAVEYIDQLAKKKTDVQEVVKQHGSQVQSKVQDNMDNAYIHGYSTGKTKRNTTLTFADQGMTVIIEPHTEYFKWLEYGTRKMEAMPTLHPAFYSEIPSFIQDIEDIFKK